jgi:hypothetical protein
VQVGCNRQNPPLSPMQKILPFASCFACNVVKNLICQPPICSYLIYSTPTRNNTIGTMNAAPGHNLLASCQQSVDRVVVSADPSPSNSCRYVFLGNLCTMRPLPRFSDQLKQTTLMIPNRSRAALDDLITSRLTRDWVCLKLAIRPWREVPN